MDSLNLQEEQNQLQPTKGEFQEQRNAAGNENAVRTEEALEERTYSQAAVEEIIQDHLRRFQSMPVSADQRAAELAKREMKLEKKSYLAQKIITFSKDAPRYCAPMREIDLKNHDFFSDYAEGLYGFLEDEMDCFTKAVDSIFDLLIFVGDAKYEAGYYQRRDNCDDGDGWRPVQRDAEERNRNIVGEIFKAGGRF